MLFGKRLGMKTVLISGTKQDLINGYRLIDFSFPDLLTFAAALPETGTQ
jgi:hypothetical protein